MSNEDLTQIQEDWDQAFSALYTQVKSGNCPMFYMLSESHNILFWYAQGIWSRHLLYSAFAASPGNFFFGKNSSSRWVAKNAEPCAYIARSTKGFRQHLKDEGGE